MSPTDRERLEIAYRAWHAAGPSDAELDAGVRRVGRAMRATRRADPIRRLATVAATALALCAAMAYGASGGGFRPRFFAPAEEAASESVSVLGKAARSGARRAARGYHAVRSHTEQAGLERSPIAAEPETPIEPDSTSPDPTSPEPAPTPVDRQAGPPRGAAAKPGKLPRKPEPARAESGAAAAPDDGPSASASWGQIGEALAKQDETRAKKLLSSLARDSGDGATRAKAQLGLAQLALARGDCRRATKLALSVARTPGLDAKLVARAHDVVVRCDLP